ncbi:hypothetical protein MCNF_50420 [Mycolicibacterium confluentis]|uniref:Sporulation regulator WhiA C-terminal domain-containing protein n=1 Tax=Mycolicibacterium confluentis TaxID=28047 RepID=A0A7I7Y434_9MYCO|nr:hypothetical protein MCNF_50420 [Mycolicibacterium confluentis]
MRLEHPDASLEELGRLAQPPMTKDAIAGQLRRLMRKDGLAEEKAKAQAVQCPMATRG